MNTPAQCGAIKPPKPEIYSEAPHARPDETASTGPASPASPTIATTNPTSHEHTRPMRRNQTPENGHLLRSTSVGPQQSPTPPTRRARSPTAHMHPQRPAALVVDTEHLHIAQSHQQLAHARRVILLVCV